MCGLFSVDLSLVSNPKHHLYGFDWLSWVSYVALFRQIIYFSIALIVYQPNYEKIHYFSIT